MIMICGFIEITMINKLIKTTSDIPNFLINDFINEMKKDKYKAAYVHVFLYLFLILILIPLAIQQIMKLNNYRQSSSFDNKDLELTTKMTQETPDTPEPSDFVTPS